LVRFCWGILAGFLALRKGFIQRNCARGMSLQAGPRNFSG
jgi:hypothetical protein